MKKRKFGMRIAAMLLAIMMMVPMSLLEVVAAVGDLSNVSTGLTGAIDTSDTISLPIKILDYENDGMLFEFAEAYAGKSGVKAAKTATDFGATWYEDYTIRTSVGGSINTGNYWSDVSLALKTDTYANYTRATWAGNTTANWTGNRAGAVLADFSESSTYTTDQVRYMVVVFRSNVRSGSFTVGLNRANLNGAGTDGNYTGNIAVTTENNTNWTYAVLDLKTGTLGSNWSKGAVYGVYVGLPVDASGEWMDLAHVAFFSNKEQATAFGEYALTDGSDRGDNRGFGLLRSSRTQSGGTAFDSIIDDTTTVEQLNTYGDTTSIDFSSLTTLGYTLLGTFGEKGIANVGLLESSLSAEGYPVYKQEVVTYLAYLLKHSLGISERTSDGWKNYRYVKGTASNIYGNVDLASALRTKINGNMGSYAEAKGKNLVGTWTEVSGNIASYYDAAYFLLNSIFVSGSYNELQDDYNYLVLSAGTDTESGDKVYVFDGGFTTSATPASAQMAIEYNTTKHTIQNTSAAGKTHFVYEGTSTTTLNPFLPVTDDNNATGMTQNPYYQDDGVINSVKKQTAKDTLYERDFNFAMVSEGEFVYHADDELFFEFEGDDDVYLFINDELVMDIGSAHSIDIVRFDLNDYVNEAKASNLGSDTRNNALALEEGNTYSFKFYYMERHSYGSNIRICTNIRVTDPSMVTKKTAWQDKTELDFGSIVDKDKVVEYGFGITNNGEENLYNLTFTDNDIGVKLDPTNGLTVTGIRVYDENGGELTASDLTAEVSHPDYADIKVTFADNNALKDFLTNLTASGTQADGGLFIGATVVIRGIGYKLSEEQIKETHFDNTVFTTATNSSGSKTLQGQASMRVFVPADPMYYEWAGHDLSVTKAKLVDDVLAAINQEGNALEGEAPNLTKNNVNKIELVTKPGNPISSPYVSIDESYNLTINYDTPGSKVFYVKITHNSSKNHVIVPVLINVTDVKDSVYVLDYGLKVDLTDNNELTKNDTLTVPGRTTNSGVLAIGSDGAYSPNEITFESKTPVDGSNGTYEINGTTVTYKPDEFMEGMDTVQVALNVYESDIIPSSITGELDINNEVEMYKNISVIPANVVYYEDDFSAIKYADTDGDDTTTTTNSFERVGDSDDLRQSVDQEQVYGQDETYQNSSNTEKSGGTLTTIEIKDNKTCAYFTFKGTGFELIGRTNAEKSATITVKVFDKDNNRIKTIPVITEFDNNDDGGSEEIYQVPVIRVKDLDIAKAPFRVEISGVPANEYDENGDKVRTKQTYFYIDGLRIYNPLAGDDNEELVNNYLPEENGAQFIEIRDMIAEGYAAAVEWTGADITVSSGTTTWTENYDGTNPKDSAIEFTANEVDSVDSYLLEGPNNEVYMMGDYLEAALVFYVKETGADVHNFQIGVHEVDEGLFVGAESTIDDTTTVIKYSDVSDNANPWVSLPDEISSATEQYYTIDYTKCEKMEDESYQVVVLVDSGMASFTGIKLNGLELQPLPGGEEAQVVLLSLRSQMLAADSSSEDNIPEVEKPEDGTTEDVKPEDGTTEAVKPEDGTTEAPETDKPEQNKPSSNNNWWEKLFGNWWGNNDEEDEEEPETPDSTQKPEDGTTETPDSTEDPEEGTTEDTTPEEDDNTSSSTGIFGWLSNLFGGWFK